MWDIILDFIFPPECVNCGISTAHGKFICGKCFISIKPCSGLFCGRCGARIPDKKTVCHKDMPYISGAASSYENEALRNMIHALKFKGVKNLAKDLSYLLGNYFTNEKLAGDIIVPVPLGKQRETERGFNQSELLADGLKEITGIPVIKCLKRTKETKPQSGIKGKDERNKNVEDAFCSSEEVKGKTIILIDDVSTSGSTFFYASRALKKAGALRIYALAVARA